LLPPPAEPQALLDVTVLPAADGEESKLPVPLHVTTSPPTTPVSVQLIAAVAWPS
jgi:hypothetical protein